jgi:AcrR family transcriptional regulator
MESQNSKAGARRPRRDGRRDRNRESLLAAAIDLLIREGLAALTPTRVTEQAGLHKPAFYAHFKDVPECVAQVVQRLGAISLARDLALHRDALRAVPYELAAEQRVLEATLRQALEYRSLYQLMGRHRYDDGPLGVALRENIALAVEGMTELLWELGLRYGLAAHHLKQVAILAELLTEHTLVAITRVVEGRATDIAAEAGLLARSNDAMVKAELERLLGEPGGSSRV